MNYLIEMLFKCIELNCRNSSSSSGKVTAEESGSGGGGATAGGGGATAGAPGVAERYCAECKIQFSSFKTFQVNPSTLMPIEFDRSLLLGQFLF